MGNSPGGSYVPPQECFKVVNPAVAGTTKYYTRKFDIQQCAGAGFQTFSLGGSGQWLPQVSNKPNPAETTDTDWTDISALMEPVIAAVAAGAPANQWIPLGGLEAKWVRLAWVNASGDTDVPEAYFCAKPTG